MSEFSSELNVGYHTNVQDTQTSFVADLLGGATATVVDAGASLWNALPGVDDVNTADLLGRVSDNALRVYQEHPDAVHMASFIGTSFIPGTLAMKGMNAMRNGSKAVNWFTKVGREADMAKVTKMFEEGQAGTKMYREAVRGIYAKTAVNQAIDAAAMEVAVIGTLHSSPVLEDYWKDPAKNFAIGVALGGVIGIGAGLAADRFALKEATGKLMEDSISRVTAKTETIAPNMTGATAVRVGAANIEGYQGILENLKASGKDLTNSLDAQLANKLLLNETRKVDETFKAMLSPELRALPVQATEALKKTVHNTHEMLGVDSISHVNTADLEVAGMIRRPGNTTYLEFPNPINPDKTAVKIPVPDLGPSPVLTETTVLEDGTKSIVDRTAVYFQDLGLYGKRSDLKHYAGAVVLGKDSSTLAKELGKNFGVVPDHNAVMQLATMSAAEWQGRYIGALSKFAGYDARALAKVQISESDAAALTGALSRLRTDPMMANETILVSGLKDGGYTLERMNASQIEQKLYAAKHESIRTLMRQGIPFESIAVKTNTDLEVIREFALSGDKSLNSLVATAQMRAQQGGKPWGSLVSSVDDIPEVLDVAKQPLVLKGNQRKTSYAEALGKLHSKTLDDINREVTSSALFSSENPMARELGTYLFDQNRAGLDLLRAGISKMNDHRSGSAMFNSFDAYTRNMGDVGAVASAFGKQVQHIANSYIERINKPLAEAMSKISTSAAETVEFNTFHEVNAGLSGWRKFDPETGKILQKTMTKNAAGKDVEILVPAKFQGQDFVVVSDSVKAAITHIQDMSPELRALMNTSRKITGAPDVHDIGLWVPSFNPTNKHIAYLHDAEHDVTKLIWAHSEAEYKELVSAFRKKVSADGNPYMRVVTQGDDKAEWSRLNGRLDVMTMTVADAGMKKSGSSASAIVRSDNNVFTEIAEGYTHFVNSQMRQLADLSMHDITSRLRDMSHSFTNEAKAQPLSGIQAILNKPKDTAAIMHNALIGSTNLGEYAGWKSASQSFETVLAYGTNVVSSIWDSTVGKLQKGGLLGFKKKPVDAELLTKLDYEALSKDLAAKGIKNPWAAFDDEAAKMYGFAKLEDSPDTSKRIIFASNALAATLALRVGELAQPLVNIMSLPILSSMAIATKAPDTFIGVAKGVGSMSPVQILYEGARASNSPVFKSLGEKWEKLGYFSPMVSEANETLKAARSMNRGMVAQVEKMLDSKMVEIMSKPSDWAESFTRRQTMFTGAVLAKRLYPGLSDEGVTIFARDFMDKSLGNFHSAQRPVLFQGTLGVALGLFQTYSLTLAQNVYRHLELKEYKALGKAALTQAGIFGTGSLPGFTTVSNAIGEHFSDDHFDLMTGTYRALPDKMADMVLYGLPAIAGTGISSRGNSSFRFPGVTDDDIVALAFAKQASEGVMRVANAFTTDVAEVPRAFGEALSLQSMSRPVARMSEVAMGRSVDRHGDTIQSQAEVWTTSGIISRVLSTRPLSEMKLREMDHLKTYYNTLDRDNRDALMFKLKTGIRNGTLDDAQVEAASHEYLRNGGTPTGWRAAYAKALATTDTSGKENFANLLKPDSPFNYMVNSLDGGN